MFFLLTLSWICGPSLYLWMPLSGLGCDAVRGTRCRPPCVGCRGVAASHTPLGLSNASRCRRRVAVDISPAMPFHAAAGVEAMVCDATNLSMFPDGSFDAVLASNFFELLEHDVVTVLLDDVRRVLRPGGHVILIQPNFRLASKRYFDDYTHRTIFADSSLSDLVRSRDFTVTRSEARFLPFSMRSRL